MKINSELPYGMLRRFNLELNEYDFVLFHLYISEPQYREYYKEVRKQYPDRTMILDNSAYEFFVKGETLDLQKFKWAIEDLQPTYYILPDVLMDQTKTLEGVQEFVNHYIPDCDSEPIAVAQGMTEEELLYCLHVYKDNGIDNICIPFHNSFFKEMEPTQNVRNDFMRFYGLIDPIEDMKYAMGRVMFVRRNWMLLKTFDYVHFLGSHCPYEKTYYKEFDSMDTGYPVKLGYEGKLLGKETSKPTTIIDDFFHEKLTPATVKLIHTNVKTFKSY